VLSQIAVYMTSYDHVRKRLEKILDENITLNVEKGNPHSKETPSDILVETTEKFSGASCTSSTIQFVSDKSGECLAHAELSTFDSEQIAVIDWIEVEKELRGNGIGRLLRKAVVEDLSNNKEIYTAIENDKMISVALDQGFKQIDEGELSEWFIRS